MNKQFDIVIIGGGPAGAVAAMYASKLGYRCAIIERDSFPRDKICGDGVTIAIIKHLAKDLPHLMNILTNESFVQSKKMTFILPDKSNIDLDNTHFFTLPRFQFDNLLWSSIQQDVSKYEKVSNVAIEYNEDYYLTTFSQNNKSITLSSKFIIGADGYGSIVKRTFFKDLTFNVRVASRFYISSFEKNYDAYEFHFKAEILPGYFWIFPVENNKLNTGVYLPKSLPPKKLIQLHQKFLKEHLNIEIDKKLISTWSIPSNGNFAKLGQNNVLLIGDAAGLCDNLIGHGIDAAMLSSEVAIRSIDYFQNNNEKKYSLPEIYRFNLTQYFKNSLNKSNEAYLLAEKNASPSTIIKNYVLNELQNTVS